MKILAIETATAHGSLALAQNGKIIDHAAIGERFEHSRTLTPRLERLLKETGWKPADIDLIGVSKGPGSFTGIRVGMACAKGMGMGLNVPVLGVSTLEVLLAGALNDPLLALGDVKRLAVLIDAKKGEFFLQFFARGARKSAWKPQKPSVLPEQELAGIMAVRSKASMPDTLVISPQLSKLRGLLSDLGNLAWDIKDRHPLAQDLAVLASQRYAKAKQGDEALTPMYIRKTDAELLFKNKPRSVFRWERAT